MTGLFDFLKSKAAGTVLNAAGRGLSAYGASQQQQQQRDFKFNRTMAETVAAAHLDNQTNNIIENANTLRADPLGASQRFAQRNALMSAILPNIRPFTSTPGDPGIAAMVIPRRTTVGNIDPMIPTQLYGPQATMGSIAQRDMARGALTPNAAPTDMTSMFGEVAAPYMNAVQQYFAARRQARADEDAKRNQALSHPSGGWPW
jgi:hypothetical protein